MKIDLLKQHIPIVLMRWAFLLSLFWGVGIKANAYDYNYSFRNRYDVSTVSPGASLYADSAPDSETIWFEITNGTVTNDKPYFEFKYGDLNRDNQSADDVVRNIEIRIYSGNRWLTIATMPKCHDQLTCMNTYSGGAIQIVNGEAGNVNNGWTRTVLVRYYPGVETPTKLRLYGSWDWDENGGSKEGGDWPFYYEAPVKVSVSLPAVTYTREPGSVIKSSVSGVSVPSDEWTASFYPYINSKSGESKLLNYGTPSAAWNASTSVDHTESATIQTSKYLRRNVYIPNGSYGKENEKTYLSQSLKAVDSYTLKGYAYPSNVNMTTSMWDKKATVTWTANTSGRDTDGKWYVFRYNKSEGTGTRVQLGSVAVGTTTYTDRDANLEFDTDYVYEVSFGLTGWNLNTPEASLTQSATANIACAFTMNLTAVPASNSIKLTWTHPAIPVSGGATFTVYRSADDAAYTNIGTVNVTGTSATSHSYEDKGLSNACVSYRYYIKTSLLNKDFSSSVKNASITGRSRVEGMTVSKGTYSNMVKVTWDATQVGTDAAQYRIMRRLLGSTGDYSQVYTTQGSATTYYFEDNSAAPGQYYEYAVRSYAKCGDTYSISAELTDNGFSQSTGTVSGRITYGTGTAVEGTRVNLTKDADDDNLKEQFYAMRINGLGGGVRMSCSNEQATALFGGTKAFSIQTWVNVDEKLDKKPIIISTYKGFGVYAALQSDGTYLLTIRVPNTAPAGYKDMATSIKITPNAYHHLTLSCDGKKNWTLRKVEADTQATITANTVVANTDVAINTSDPSIGFGTDTPNNSAYVFKGYLDEVRVWSKVLTDKEILTNYNRLLAGTESGLKLYWPLDEGISGQTIAYDYSKTGGVANGNHGDIAEASELSTNTPTADQLGLYGLTDAQGNYVIRGVPFTGEGTNYTLTPALGIHGFSPKYATRYVSSSSLNHSAVDFNDVSSFPVTGVVYYEGTVYPVEGATLYIDGTICSKDGEAVTTKSDGSFEISVPIGDHFIQVKKQGHTFVSNGRYPADANGLGTVYTFDRSMSNLTFHDNTLVTIAGRVIGGEIEEGKPIGMGLSKNNIGKATIKLSTGYRMNVVEQKNGTTVSYENNPVDVKVSSPTSDVNSSAYRKGGDAEAVKYIYVTTDSLTGEFAALVPPVGYKVEEIKVASNQNIIFDNLPTVDASNPLILTTDSATLDNGTVKHFEYCASLKKAYRVKPSFTVTDKKDGAFGEAEYEYADMQGKETLKLYTVDEKNGGVTYKYGYPIFLQNSTYKFKLKAFESYENKDNKDAIMKDIVPLSGTKVTITNQMSASQEVYVEGDDSGKFHGNLKSNELELDSIGEAVYSFRTGFPNIIKDQNFTRGLNISFLNNGQTINWDDNDTFKGVVIGNLPTGTNFVTAGPDKLLMVLRDPPGTNSNAYWEEGRTVTTVDQDGGSFITNNQLESVVHAGADNVTITGTPGFGVIADANSTADVTVGVNVNLNVTSMKESVTKVTTTKRISTSDAFDFVGASGDVFVGCATNILFGDARAVDFQRGENSTYTIGRADIMTTGTKFGTAFNYSQNYIENTLMPNMANLRNAMLTVVSEGDYANFENTTGKVVYLTKLAANDKRFGSSNTDQNIWGSAANTGTNRAKLEGPSYKMVIPKVRDANKAYQDSVLWYNEQIALWTNTLAENEKAKVNAIENRSEWLDTNISFDAGAILENSTKSCSSKSHTVKTETETLAVLGSESGAEILGIGVSLTAKTTTGGAAITGNTDEEENCITTGYTLAENGSNDALTVDVFKAPDGFGAIFSTRGGQTCCPYEGEAQTKYYRSGTTISTATMQIEVPQISVTNAVATDVPSGKNASYELKLTNLSETEEDVWFNLAMLDETNPNGAKLSLDGAVLTDGRAILVRAGETLKKTLQLTQTNSGVLDYKNIKLVLKSQCQADPTGIHAVIADTVAVSAHFVPTCSDITLEIESRTMNMFTSDTLSMSVKDFDRSYKSFKGLRIQYKYANNVDWALAKEYVLNEVDKTNNNELLSEGSPLAVRFDMSNSALFPDGTYQFRAVTMCDFGSGEVNNESETIIVTKDMARPQVLGTPNPSTGILLAGDDISVMFNETVREGALTQADNFIVTGALNGATVGHCTALQLSGAKQVAATEADILLAKQNFAGDMWINLTSAGTILEHGSAQNKFVVTVDESRHLILTVNGNRYTSTKTIPLNKWSFLSYNYVYADNASTFSAQVSYDASTVVLFNTISVADYTGIGRLIIGKNLNGAIHEVTLWNRARSLSESQSEMYITKTPSTPNLIGYWKMDEGMGTKITDCARNRHMIASAANWYLNNVNKAAALDGAGHLALNISACSARSTDDYAVELWFRAASQANASLFAVGDDKLALRTNTSGKLTLVTDGLETVLSSTDYLDNAWHHFALNVLRNGTAIAYVDGTNVKQLAATQVPALAGAAIYVGANRYLNDKGEYAFRNYFKGEVDEFRYWNAKLTGKMLAANRNSRIDTATVSGLVAYYPFETTHLDANNQLVTDFSLMDFSSNAAGDAEVVGVSEATSAPALKEAPTVTNLQYTFTASEKEVYLTLTDEPSRLEGVTVNFTVRNIRDLNNNLTLPVMWSAYVSRNRLKWAESEVNLVKTVEDGKSFSVEVSNQGSTSEQWVLTNLPSWLTASEMQGTLSPLSSQKVTFTVAPSTPIGNYEETIYMYGNDAIYEPLIVSLKVKGDEPAWSVDPSKYELSMNMIGQLQVSGIASEDTDDKVAAFVDNECVGVASPVYYSRYDTYFIMLDVYGNSASQGKKVTFKVWDASMGEVYPAVTTTYNVLFRSNQLVGSIAKPFVWNAKDLLEQTVALAKGWKWTSLYIEPGDNTVSTLFTDVKSSMQMVKGKSSFTVPSAKGWSGLLKQIETGKMYKLRSTEAAMLNVIGNKINLAEAPLTITPRWNWIGYNTSFNLSVSDAFASLAPENGDMVKGQNGFSIYNDYEWVGTLSSLMPGCGYMYQSKASANKTFTYPANTTLSKSRMKAKVNKANTFIPVDENTYSGNMTFIAIVKDGEELIGNAEVGVFAETECRGSSTPDEDGIHFLTVAGEGYGTVLTFKVKVGDVINDIDFLGLVYEDDGSHGSLENPYVIQLDPAAASIGQINSNISVYPTRVIDYVYVEAPGTELATILVQDINGKSLYMDMEPQRNNRIAFGDYPQGIYLITVITKDGKQSVYRIVR